MAGGRRPADPAGVSCDAERDDSDGHLGPETLFSPRRPAAMRDLDSPFRMG